MIAGDQPAIFDSARLTVGLSSKTDGDMRCIDEQDHTNYYHRLHFLDELSIEMTQATRLQATFDDVTDFARYITLDDSYEGEGMLGDTPLQPADAMVVTRPNHAIYLQLADCVGAVLYDKTAGILMVSHLGRHSTEQDGAAKSVQYLKDQFDCQPHNLQIWLSPAVGSASYPLRAFDGQSLHQVITEQLLHAGVPLDNIEASAVDTATSSDYFSHSQFLAGNRGSDGRFAIAAMMRD